MAAYVIARFKWRMKGFFRMMFSVGLLIPGAALTNAVRDMLVGHTVSGLLRMFESLLLALMLAIGFGSAIYLFGV